MEVRPLRCTERLRHILGTEIGIFANELPVRWCSRDRVEPLLSSTSAAAATALCCIVSLMSRRSVHV